MRHPDSRALLKVEHLSVGLKGQAPLVKDVNFTLYPQECLAIVGESGAGKSLSQLALLDLLGRGFDVSGKAYYEGNAFLGDAKRTRALRGSEIFFMVQQPMSAFDPLMRIGQQLLETLKVIQPKVTPEKAQARILDMLQTLQFDDPRAILERYPSELSGGMLQRIMIACALLTQPKLIIADEPTSALDVIASQEVIKAFQSIRAQHHTSLIIITHDLGVAHALADQFLVMKDGNVIEYGNRALFKHPQAPYTQYLISTRQMLMNHCPGIAEG